MKKVEAGLAAVASTVDSLRDLLDDGEAMTTEQTVELTIDGLIRNGWKVERLANLSQVSAVLTTSALGFNALLNRIWCWFRSYCISPSCHPATLPATPIAPIIRIRYCETRHGFNCLYIALWSLVM